MGPPLSVRRGRRPDCDWRTSIFSKEPDHEKTSLAIYPGWRSAYGDVGKTVIEVDYPGV